MSFHDFGDINVTIETGDGTHGRIEVKGPRTFVDQIDWARAQKTAITLASFAPTMHGAVALAVQQQYAAWHGYQTFRA